MKILPGHFTKKTNDGWVEDRVSLGIVYKITQQGTLEQLWTIKNILPANIYPSNAYYLADDGVHLVKISSATNMDDKNALVIYNRGQLFRSYAPKTFMPNLKKLQIHTCGSGSWLSSDYQQGIGNNPTVAGTTLFFKAIDGKLWNFDVRQPPK